MNILWSAEYSPKNVESCHCWTWDHFIGTAERLGAVAGPHVFCLNPRVVSYLTGILDFISIKDQHSSKLKHWVPDIITLSELSWSTIKSMVNLSKFGINTVFLPQSETNAYNYRSLAVAGVSPLAKLLPEWPNSQNFFVVTWMFLCLFSLCSSAATTFRGRSRAFNCCCTPTSSFVATGFV